MKKEKGITLVALVITIVLMVILVGVTISVMINSGIIDQTKRATSKWKEEEEKERLAMLSQELAIMKASGNTTIEEVETKLKEQLGENTKSVDNSSYREDTYIITETEDGKKYILDEDWSLTEATDLITIWDVSKEYIKNNTLNNENTYTIKNITDDIEASDEVFRDILGNASGLYDTNKYRFVILCPADVKEKSGRLLCYPDKNLSLEIIQTCEKMGIYLWGDVNHDGIVDQQDVDILISNASVINKTDKTNRAWLVSNVHYTKGPAINGSDGDTLQNFVSQEKEK